MINIVSFFIEIFISILSVAVVLPSSYKITQLNRKLILFLLELEDDSIARIVLRTSKFIKLYCDKDTIGIISKTDSVSVNSINFSGSDTSTGEKFRLAIDDKIGGKRDSIDIKFSRGADFSSLASKANRVISLKSMAVSMKKIKTKPRAGFSESGNDDIKKNNNH